MLLLPEPIRSVIVCRGKEAAPRGELASILEFGPGNSDAVLEEESPLEFGRLLLSSSSNLGSIISRARSCQPRLVLNCASARRFCSLRAIYRFLLVGAQRNIGMEVIKGEEISYLAHYSSPQDLVSNDLGPLFLPC